MKENNEKYYAKTKELLSSMAMRSDHGFGIYEEEQQERMIKKMDALYEAYVSGKTNEQIEEIFPYCLITIKQVREEVNGKGFYKPIEKSIYTPFGKK